MSKIDWENQDATQIRNLMRGLTPGLGVYSTLDDKKINLKIEVDQKNSLNAVDGHKVLVELGKKLDNNNKYEGIVLENPLK